MSTAADHWATSLRQWGIPAHILESAPQSPWIHPVENFRPTGDLFVDTPSRLRALEVLPEGGSVLDVGCGGGRAAFGLTPPAATIVGVDHQQVMLDLVVDEAHQRGVEALTVLGDWPDVAGQTPVCDVVVCHHVFYNVADLGPFAAALTDKARRRVVVEMPRQHPLASLSAAWLHFWDLVRPTSPTADDALAVLVEQGLDAHLEPFEIAAPATARPVTDLDVEHTRIRLCLPADRDTDVRTFLEAQPPAGRSLATVWWDV